MSRDSGERNRVDYDGYRFHVNSMQHNVWACSRLLFMPCVNSNGFFRRMFFCQWGKYAALKRLCPVGVNKGGMRLLKPCFGGVSTNMEVHTPPAFYKNLVAIGHAISYVIACLFPYTSLDCRCDLSYIIAIIVIIYIIAICFEVILLSES